MKHDQKHDCSLAHSQVSRSTRAPSESKKCVDFRERDLKAMTDLMIAEFANTVI